MVGGRSGAIVGTMIIVVVIMVALLSWQYSKNLEQQRAQAIAQLISKPEFANCRYDASTCPQAQETVFPTASALGLTILGVLLGLYLIRSDMTQRKILDELKTRQNQLSVEEKRALVLSVLTSDEKSIVEAVRQQPGISQATLRLRTDMSKAKLSLLLKDLESRNIIKRVEDGKTNEVHLKIGL